MKILLSAESPYGKIEFEYEKKHIKNINLRVRPDLSVYVSVPYRYGAQQARAFVLAKAAFIMRARGRLAERRENSGNAQVPADGAAVRLRGKDYVLRARQSPIKGADLSQGSLLLSVRDPADAAMVVRAYDRWLRRYAAEVFEMMCRGAYASLRGKALIFPKIKVRSMTSRWGSCNKAKGVVTFNLRLIEAEDDLIAYVALHEMCHMVYADHGRDFHALMASLMPDYKARRKKLNESIALK
jgi:predicted metal-dependent hydrolase